MIKLHIHKSFIISKILTSPTNAIHYCELFFVYHQQGFSIVTSATIPLVYFKIKISYKEAKTANGNVFIALS